MDPIEQACILEEFIAIATEQDHTVSSNEFEDDDDMDDDDDDDEDDDDNYFSDSDEDLYYYIADDEQSTDNQTSIINVEDYEADVVSNSEVTILSNEGENWSRLSENRSGTDSDVVFLDDVIIIVD